MNIETLKVVNFIKNNPKYHGQIILQRQTHNNFKDFSNQLRHIVRLMVTNEEPLRKINKKNVNLKAIAEEFFQ